MSNIGIENNYFFKDSILVSVAILFCVPVSRSKYIFILTWTLHFYTLQDMKVFYVCNLLWETSHLKLPLFLPSFLPLIGLHLLSTSVVPSFKEFCFFPSFLCFPCFFFLHMVSTLIVILMTWKLSSEKFWDFSIVSMGYSSTCSLGEKLHWVVSICKRTDNS